MVRFLVGAVLSKGWGAATTLGFDPSCLILSPCATNSVIKGWMYDELSLGIAHKWFPLGRIGTKPEKRYIEVVWLELWRGGRTLHNKSPGNIYLFRDGMPSLSSSYNISGLVPVCWLLFQCFWLRQAKFQKVFLRHEQWKLTKTYMITCIYISCLE